MYPARSSAFLFKAAAGANRFNHTEEVEQVLEGNVSLVLHERHRINGGHVGKISTEAATTIAEGAVRGSQWCGVVQYNRQA